MVRTRVFVKTLAGFTGIPEEKLEAMPEEEFNKQLVDYIYGLGYMEKIRMLGQLYGAFDNPMQRSMLERQVQGNALVVASKGRIYCCLPGMKIFLKARAEKNYALHESNIYHFLLNEDKLYDFGSYGLMNTRTDNKLEFASVMDACVHMGKIYWSAKDGIHTTENTNNVFGNFAGKQTIAKREHANKLVSHEGRLYEAGKEGIFETMTGKKIGERHGWISDFVEHNGKLYDINLNYELYDTLENKKIKTLPKITNLCSHNHQLYGYGNKTILEVLEEKPVAEREDCISDLISHNGKLFDCGNYRCIFDTLEDPKGRNQLWRFDNEVSAMISVPAYVLE